MESRETNWKLGSNCNALGHDSGLDQGVTCGNGDKYPALAYILQVMPMDIIDGLNVKREELMILMLSN